MTSALDVNPTSIYDDGVLCCQLGVTGEAIARARRSGKLRFTRQGRRTLYLGEWVIAWLRNSAPPHEEVHHAG